MITVFPAPMLLDGEPVRAGVQGEFVVDAGHRGPFGPAVPLVRAMTRWLDESELVLSFGRPWPSSHAIITSLSSDVLGEAVMLARPIRVDRLVRERGGATAPLAPLGRGLGPVLRLRYRDDRSQWSARGLVVERPRAFDERFADLWAWAADRFRVVGERSVRQLNWKYGLDPSPTGRRHDLLAVVDRSGDVLGYAASLEVAGRLHVHDLLARSDRRVIDALLGALVAEGRRRGVLSVSVALFGGDPLLVERLRSFGFSTRSRLSFTVRWSPRAPSPRPGADAWYAVHGDEDF